LAALPRFAGLDGRHCANDRDCDSDCGEGLAHASDVRVWVDDFFAVRRTSLQTNGTFGRDIFSAVPSDSSCVGCAGPETRVSVVGAVLEGGDFLAGGLGTALVAPRVALGDALRVVVLTVLVARADEPDAGLVADGAGAGVAGDGVVDVEVGLVALAALGVPALDGAPAVTELTVAALAIAELVVAELVVAVPVVSAAATLAAAPDPAATARPLPTARR